METRVQSCALGGIALSAAFGLAGVAGATSVTYDFGNITGNKATNAATEGQFSVTVSDAGSGMVTFRIDNAAAGATCSITDVYFYDGALIGATLAISSSAGVSFSTPATPGALPGGAGYGLPSASVEFSADSDNPANGVNPGEWVEFKFSLVGGSTFADVIAAMNSGLSPPFVAGTDIVVGIHVQAYANGGSESFVTVPLPAPLLMGLAGLGLVGLVRLRHRRFLILRA